MRKIEALSAYRSQFPLEPDMFPEFLLQEIFGCEYFVASSPDRPALMDEMRPGRPFLTQRLAHCDQLDSRAIGEESSRSRAAQNGRYACGLPWRRRAAIRQARRRGPQLASGRRSHGCR
jgi:hypothetical protein